MAPPAFRYRFGRYAQAGLIEAFFCLSMGLLIASTGSLEPDDGLGFALEVALVLTAAVVGRRPRSVAVAAMVIMAALLLRPIDEPRFSSLCSLIIVVSVTARGHGRWALVTGTVYAFLLGMIETGFPITSRYPTTVSFWAFFLALAWVVGQAIHNNQLERQRLQEEKLLAARALRQAVARDLHDTLARSTTNMVLRAEQAKLRGVGDPGLGGDLDFIISAGGAVIRDLRALMETLRRTDVDADLDALSELKGVSLAEVLRQQLDHLSEGGFQPRLLQDVSLDELSPAVAAELARAVIEAAANIAKHAAPGTACEFLIARDDDEVELVVVNRPGGRRVAQSNHLGLLGARERIGFLGGELTVTETPESFVLQVRLPIGAQR